MQNREARTSLSRRRFLGQLGRGAAAASAGALGTATVVRLLQQSVYSQEDPAVYGQWEKQLVGAPLVAIHAILLRTGKVLLIQGQHASQVSKVYLWDPISKKFDQRPVPDGHNLFCAGHCALPDGKVLFPGGQIGFPRGLKETHIFDPAGPGSWAEAAEMKTGRWYPTCTALADGRVLAVSGFDENGKKNTTPEVYNPDQWTQLGGAARELTTYPFMFLLGSGKVFHAGPNGESKLLNVSSGTWENAPSLLFQLKEEDTPAVTWVDLVKGVQKVLVCGGQLVGSSQGTKTTWTIEFDLNGNVQGTGWHQSSAMNFARTHHNATLGPDGKVYVTGGAGTAGGGSSNVYRVEIFDPDSESWQIGAEAKKARLHHSTGLLLPDGRIAVTGSGPGDATGEKTIEIYRPPYFFKGTRPTITSAPASINYTSSSFSITVDSEITEVALLRPGAVTHSFNQDQRYVRLATFTPAASGSLAVPVPNANLAPPGYYMLFVVNSNGVPSVASWVKLGS